MYSDTIWLLKKCGFYVLPLKYFDIKIMFSIGKFFFIRFMLIYLMQTQIIKLEKY